ncbi:hypothetical protein L6164_023373 [Bauhinia variegata]|uniref:Uncharacterized protein n=1 Tax=Bauhinia variegata TaxID=167791 RepID=A0ACB9MLP8_BAUVA|nr:hypothetical protein L6164_023373 [Bauhinia variegata]
MAAKSCPDSVYVPEDITRDIFSRLPVKSLTRFQSLSKDIPKLFKTPTFISEHLHHSRSNPSLLCMVLSLQRNMYLIKREMKEEPEQVNCPINLLHVCVVGSCNGLICLHHVKLSSPQVFSIWNPAKKEFRQIEPPKNKIHDFILSPGFGFSATANDYKIVILENKVQRVYSLSRGTWRETKVQNLDDIHFPSRFYQAVSADGALFWKNIGCLISFDIDKEVFSKIELPPGVDDTYCLRLAVYKDSIAMLHCTSDDPVVVDVWVMDEKSATGKCSNWVKLFTVGPIPGSTLEYYPFNFWRGELLFVKLIEGARVSLYNFNSNKFKNLPFIPPCNIFRRWFLYVESLVPLDG